MTARLTQLRTNKNVSTDTGAGDPEELLVFGYQCKLFRDDEKALYIEEEKHLIPWMGDTSLMIDRYDGRGHLHDLGQYDADINPVSAETLSEDEKHIEAICDEERYMELHVDLADKAMYEEEELKRLHQELAADEMSAPYQAVGFSYEQYDPAEPTQDVTATQGNEDNEEPPDDEERGLFIPAPELQIPPHMECPTSMKLNSIIEKTAEFVSKHGGQMEIMIKTKQSANPQFGFLMFEHPLNPYYKHMVSMIKCGRYIPGLHKPQMQVSDSSASNSDDDGDDDDGYLHPSLRPSTSTQNLPKLPALTSSQIENTSYGMLIKRIGIITGTGSPVPASLCGSSRQNSPGEKDDNQNDENSVYDIPPPPGTEDVLLPDMQPKPSSPEPPKAAENPPSPERTSVTTVPPSDAKMIIDRMASYVVKDGIEFENQVRAQSDLRFEFLNSSHPHNAYYESVKAKMTTEEKERTPASKAVSFSIKFKDQDAGLLEKKASFLLNDSSDEENGHKQAAVITPAAPAADQQKPLLPAVPLPVTEESQKKLSEQRLKDKLAAAAREKLAQTTKESKHRLLQEERKRKAAMFVTMLKTGSKSELHSAPIGPDLPAVSAKRPYNKEDSTREGRSASATHHSRSKSPRQSISRSTHHRPRSKSRSPSRKHSRTNNSRSTHTKSRRSRSPELGSRHNKHKHSRKSKSRHRSRSPSEQVSAIKKEQSPDVDRLAQQSTARRTSTLELSSPARIPSTENPKYQDSENYKARSSESSVNGKPPFLEPPSEDMIVKVRKMLQASRKAIFKEDMIGD